MAITKQKKQTIVTATTASLKDALSAVFVSFKGLTVAEVNELRASLKAEGVQYNVVKKTLLKRSLDAVGVTGDMPDMPGEVAVAFMARDKGDDVTAPARGLQSFIKKFKGKLAFLGGVIEGAYLSQSATVSVATIPPVPVLRGMFANIINSPIQRFAIAMAEVAKTK